MVQAANGMVENTTRRWTGLKRRFVEQAPQDLSTSLEPVETALGEMGQAAETREQSIAAEADALAQWASQALPVVDGLRTALDAAAKVE